MKRRLAIAMGLVAAAAAAWLCYREWRSKQPSASVRPVPQRHRAYRGPLRPAGWNDPDRFDQHVAARRRLDSRHIRVWISQTYPSTEH